MRKLKLNKDLATGEGLTRRQIKSVRDRLAKQAAYIANLIESHWAGINTCQECQNEYDFKLDKADLDLIKIVYSKTMTDLSPEDLDSATSEKSQEEKAEIIANVVINDKGTIKEELRKKGYELKPILKTVVNA